MNYVAMMRENIIFAREIYPKDAPGYLQCTFEWDEHTVVFFISGYENWIDKKRAEKIIKEHAKFAMAGHIDKAKLVIKRDNK